MPTRPLGTGYDPASGWPPDDSTGNYWDNDVDLSGYGRFGPGGFAPNPRLTGPATGTPPGVSLSGPSGDSLTASPMTPNPPGAGMPRGAGPEMTGGPQNLRPGMSSTVPGPFTDVTANPGLWDRIAGILAGRATPAAMALGGAGIVGEGIRNEREGADQGLINPHGTGSQYSVSNLPLSPNGPLPGPGRHPTGPMAASPIPYDPLAGKPTGTPPPFYDPLAGEPTGVSLSPPIGSPASAVPPIRPKRTPVAAGPAAARQQPNLGSYMMPQPNIDPLSRGGRRGDGAPQMGVFGWDPNGPLFGRGK